MRILRKKPPSMKIFTYPKSTLSICFRIIHFSADDIAVAYIVRFFSKTSIYVMDFAIYLCLNVFFRKEKIVLVVFSRVPTKDLKKKRKKLMARFVIGWGYESPNLVATYKFGIENRK